MGGGQARHCGFKQYGRQHFTALQHTETLVVIRGQNENRGVVVVDADPPVPGSCNGEIAADIDAVALGCRHQRAARNTLSCLEVSSPSTKFGMVVRIVEAKRLGELGGLR